MGSEQPGLTGGKSSMVRNVAVGPSASSLEESLAAIQTMLEAQSPNCLNYAVAADTSLEYIQPHPIRPSLLQPEGLIGAPDFPTWAS
jgi:hypothetical protein